MEVYYPHILTSQPRLLDYLRAKNSRILDQAVLEKLASASVVFWRDYFAVHSIL
jgi:hypothetical protein